MATVHECDRCRHQQHDMLKKVEVLQEAPGKIWQRYDWPSSWDLCKACIEELRMFMEKTK